MCQAFPHAQAVLLVPGSAIEPVLEQTGLHFWSADFRSALRVMVLWRVSIVSCLHIMCTQVQVTVLFFNSVVHGQYQSTIMQAFHVSNFMYRKSHMHVHMARNWLHCTSHLGQDWLWNSSRVQLEYRNSLRLVHAMEGVCVF